MLSLTSVTFATLGALVGLFVCVSADSWNLTDTYAGQDFIDDFTFWPDTNGSQVDPTHGLVRYLGRKDAVAQNITYVDSNGLFHLRVDTTPTQLSGRPSARITSSKTFADGVFVVNVTHVPTGCSVWPALWMVAPDVNSYPLGGEIDILENANDQYNGNLVSLHTQHSCSISSNQQQQSGKTVFTNCTVDYATGNEGCRVEMNGTSKPTWGSSFNSAGGGIFALERSLGSAGNGIRVWFWQQSDSALPPDLRAGSQTVDPSRWGTPSVDMPVESCHADFGSLAIVIDITLCGDWAAQTYDESGCGQKFPACSYQVGYNGTSYSDAFWSIAGVRAFTSGGGDANAAISPNTETPSSAASRVLPVMLLAATVAAALLHTRV